MRRRPTVTLASTALAAGCLALAAAPLAATAASASRLGSVTASAATDADALWATDFDRGHRGWQVVLDGVMGGLSSGRLSVPDDGVVGFSGRLRLENNGGFSQIRTSVPREGFAEADGIELRVKGDGRTWNFDVRTADVRMMATGWQTSFATRDGAWTTVRLPFDDFILQSFGRRVPVDGSLRPELVESIGLTLSDKQPGAFTIELDAIRAYRADEPASASLARRDEAADGEADGDQPAGAGARRVAAADDAPGLVEVARSAGLDTLLELVAAAELTEILPDSPFTVLAPTDDAFAELPEEAVARLTSPEGRRDLRRILAHHVVPGRVPAATAFTLPAAESLAGQRLTIETGPSLRIGGARVVATDVAFDGGLVHVIDRVLVPELRTVVELAAAEDRLSTLAALVEGAGLAESLGPANDGPWTVIAPVNAAFDALPADLVETLTAPSGRRELVTVLGFHVVPGRVRLADLAGLESARTLSGEPVDVRLEGGRLRVGGASVVMADIEAANGIVHLVDAVMLPPSLSGVASDEGAAGDEGSRPALADRELFVRTLGILERAVEIGAPLFNDGNPDACAATYAVALESIVALAGPRLGGPERAVLRRGLRDAAAETDARERSWILRGAMDELYRRLAMRLGDV